MHEAVPIVTTPVSRAFRRGVIRQQEALKGRTGNLLDLSSSGATGSHSAPEERSAPEELRSRRFVRADVVMDFQGND